MQMRPLRLPRFEDGHWDLSLVEDSFLFRPFTRSFRNVIDFRRNPRYEISQIVLETWWDHEFLRGEVTGNGQRVPTNFFPKKFDYLTRRNRPWR